jgi:PAS domain-containing protein
MEINPMNPEPQAAQEATKVEKIIELVKHLCLAESMCRIYGAGHPNARESIRTMFEWVTAILANKHEIVINMTEGKVVVEGMPADERNPMIAKFAKTFNAIHADNLFFEEGLTLEECNRFYEVLCLGPRQINAQGGLPEMLKQRDITHIAVKQISYVMVRDDEKVVARDAQVIDGKIIEAAGGDQQLVEYMVQQVMKKAEERKWIIAEIKNNPKKMADIITQGIELAVSRNDSGLTETKTIEGLLENIKMVGQSLVDETSGEITSESDLQDAIMTLESEVRTRSQKLMSSETAVGFINEVLSVITSYSDQVRAKKLSDEILKGERSLRQAEKLLKTLAPHEISSEQFLIRIRSLLVDRGITEDQLLALAQEAPAAKKPRAPRKPRVVKPIADEIAKHIKTPDMPDTQRAEVAADLSGYFERELNARAKDIKNDNRRLQAELALIGHVLDRLALGIVVWDADGVIEYIDQPAAQATGWTKGNRLGSALVNACREWQFPLDTLPAETLTAWGLTDLDARFLGAIDRTTKDEQGIVNGVLLKKNPPSGTIPSTTHGPVAN